jgi:crotonobetainyl-CoA:carnitine CoA-transferase CaiB-like acyl-CoA transferase
MSGPLTGLRVVDASIMAAGPWIGALLGELGADVVKVEPPAGDGTRWVEPRQHGMGTNYLCLNVNKRGIVLDLKAPADRDRALDLIAGADVFVQNFRGGVIDRLGLGWDVARGRNARLVYCSVSGFGETGPLAREACADFVMQAYSGFARLNGRPGDALEAFRFTGYIDLTTSIVAVQAVLAALLARAGTGRGQKVEISMLQAALEMQFTRIAEYLGSGVPPAPLGSESPGLAPDRAFAALDGEVFVTAHDDAQWRGFCEAIGAPALVDDPRFATLQARVRHRTALHDAVAPRIAARPMIWWLRAFGRRGVPCALAQHFEQLRHHVQVRDNAMVAELQTLRRGRVTVGGLPWHFARTPGEVRPAPEPGADTATVLGAAPRERAVVSPSGPAAVDARGPVPVLRDLKVVELAAGVAGPMAGCRLGDLGADVTKVELGEGDWMRACPPLAADGTGVAFAALNRGKRTIRLDSDDAPDRGRLRGLVEGADVLVTDLGSARLAALGLEGADADTCPWNPRLVTIRITPFGHRGPLADAPGSELAAQAMAGYVRYVGARDEPSIRLGADVAGCSTAIFAVQATLAALFERRHSGRGQRVDLSLLNSLLSMKTVHLAAQGDPDEFEGPRVGGAYDPPERGWRTADAPITFAFGGAVGAEGKPGWTRFVEAIGLGRLLDDPRFDRSGRMTTGLGPRARELKGEYEHAFVHHSSREIVALIREHDGFASAYLEHEALLREPQVAALGIVRELAAYGRTLSVLDFPARFSELPVRLSGPAPGPRNSEPAAGPAHPAPKQESR